MSAIESKTGNKPQLANLKAFAVSNQNHSITFVNTSFSNRQIGRPFQDFILKKRKLFSIW